MEERIGVIGAGPAGIIAAGIANSLDKNVTLVEKNDRIGKKLFITGKGRCNITNNSPIEDFLSNIMTNKNFLYSSFYSFTNEDIIKLLREYGLNTKVERGNRVFPKSNKSSDVIKAFEGFLLDKSVDLRLNTDIKSIRKEGESFILTTKDNVDLVFDKIILTTGGISYPGTGSTGAGYNFADNLGHTIVELKPSLVPIEVREDDIRTLQGLSLKNVSISAYCAGKKIYEKFGEMIFTHYGISGPIVIPMSNYIYKYKDQEILLYIDLKPALTMKKMDNRLLRDFKLYSNRQIKNALDDLLPQKLIPYIIKASKINPDTAVNQISKSARNRLLRNIKGLPMTFKSFRPIQEAIVTSGGVSTSEINPSTMESKIVKGLFFAGEIIDVDGLTGGYNLQIAYSTGWLAGMNV